jgi:hypothetical protein
MHLTRPLRPRRIPTSLVVAVLATAPLAPSARADEFPNYSVSITSNQTIYTATPASSNVSGFLPHVNFPYLKRRADGTLEMDFTVGQTHGSGIFGVRGYSFDGGLTWGSFTTAAPSRPNSSLVRPAGSSSYGVSYGFSNSTGQTSWTNTLYTSTDGGVNWTFSNAVFDSAGLTYINVTNNYTDMYQVGSTLFTTGYAQQLGATRFDEVLFASTDNGAHWTRRATIASYTSDPAVNMGSEGPNEGTIAVTSTGNLLSVFRTTQTFPSTSTTSTATGLMWSMSADNGFTWTTPKKLGVNGEFPLLHALDDGSFALTYGRYGGAIMFVDPTGTRWTKPTVLYNGPGSGYVDLKKAANGLWAFAYDQSSYYPPSYNSSPPNGYVYNNNQSGNANVALLTISAQPTTDDQNWSYQFHGDVTPDKSPYAWAKTATGSISTREWAEYGQDYVRLSSATSTDRLYYTLPSSAWAGQNFSRGLILDLRARCDLATTEGGADLLISDSSHGYVTFHLTNIGVILEGLGGQASQVTYLTSAHPGYNVYDFHTYRITVTPDPSSPYYLAQLYLDANYSSPILSVSLGSTVYNMLRFGNLGSASSSNFDIDFVRYTSILPSVVVPEAQYPACLLTTLAFLLPRRRH